MQARDLMSAPVITIRPNATVGEAADLMLKHNVSCLPVLDEQSRLVGILTHTDFDLHHTFLHLADKLYTFLGSWATPKSLEEVAQAVRNRQVKDVMSHPVATVEEDVPVAELADLMVRKHVHRLPVMRGAELVGVITRHDLLKLVASGEG